MTKKLQIFRLVRSVVLVALAAVLLVSCASGRKMKTRYPMKKTLNCGR